MTLILSQCGRCDVMGKVCSKCNQSKQLDEFGPSKTGRFKKDSICRECRRISKRIHYSKNREACRKRYDNWYAKNKEKKKQYDAGAERRKRRNIASIEYIKRNKLIIQKKARDYYWANRERCKERYRKWQSENPLKNAARIRLYFGKKRKAAGTFTIEQFLNRCEFYQWKCSLCSMPLGDDITIEHRIPIDRGGSNWPANLAPAHKRCNSAKGNLTEREWRELRKDGWLLRLKTNTIEFDYGCKFIEKNSMKILRQAKQNTRNLAARMIKEWREKHPGAVIKVPANQTELFQ